MYADPLLAPECACVECGNDRRLYLARPCSHLGLCPACRDKLGGDISNIRCPVCHERVTRLERVF